MIGDERCDRVTDIRGAGLVTSMERDSFGANRKGKEDEREGWGGWEGGVVGREGSQKISDTPKIAALSHVNETLT